MPIKQIIGDLFRIKAEAYAHGVNCLGIMGAGIALEFKRRWPGMFEKYQQKCRAGCMFPGNVFYWREREGYPPVILNLFTQSGLAGATVGHIQVALVTMRTLAPILGLKSIAMPRIGCGLGHLDWEMDVEPLVVRAFYDWKGTLTVVQKRRQK